MTKLARVIFASLAVAAGCGGKVVVDQPGTGGSGGGGGGGGASDCATLQGQLSTAVTAAQACNPFINSVQCNGTAIVYDACACPHVANESNAAAVAAATSIYQAFAAGNCLLECDGCQGLGDGAYCDPSTSQCVPVWAD